MVIKVINDNKKKQAKNSIQTLRKQKQTRKFSLPDIKTSIICRLLSSNSVFFNIASKDKQKFVCSVPLSRPIIYFIAKKMFLHYA